MKEYFIKNLYMLILVLVIGLILGVLIGKPVKKLIPKICGRLFLIREYWIFVLPFFFIVMLTYSLVIKYAPPNELQIYLTILGHFVTLVFAIFIGYFAFIQVVENRLEKYKEQGYLCIKKKTYIRAKQYYEKAYVIDPKDFAVLGNLLELYLFLKDYYLFNEKLPEIKKEAIENREKIIVWYLTITKHLLQQDLGKAKELLSDFISFIRGNPDALVGFVWDFQDILASGVYKELDGECKEIFDNFHKYLTKKLDDIQKAAFEKEDYSLIKAESQKN